MKKNKNQNRLVHQSLGKGGFTLIELLVVIAIIGLISTVITTAVNGARAKAKEVRTNKDLMSLRTAIAMLENDVGKWPNGCPIDSYNNAEVYLDQPEAGIKQVPPVGVIDANCSWTTQDVANWKGPYTLNTTDAWGNSYYFDPDYYFCENGYSNARPVIESEGPNKTQEYASSNNSQGSACTKNTTDDIYLILK